MNQIITRYRNLALEAGYPANSKDSLDWFRKRVRKDRRITDLRKITEGHKNAKIMVGEMITYKYMPLMEKKLAYYDTNPLIVIMETYVDGWLGCNVHYLPPAFRAKLFFELHYSKKPMKVIAEALMNNKISKPAIKRYKAEKVMSKPVSIPKDEWEIAIQLPYENFKKASIKKVWQDSRNKI